MPSGVDADEGAVHEPHVRAASILFLSLPKKGCEGLAAAKAVADIGVPAFLYERIKVPAKNYFAEESIIRI